MFNIMSQLEEITAKMDQIFNEQRQYDEFDNPVKFYELDNTLDLLNNQRVYLEIQLNEMLEGVLV